MKLKSSLLVIIAFVAIQFIPYGHQHSNPPVATEPAWNSPQTRELFYRTCGDCHSHETAWPWYSHIAPASWLVERDVLEAREHFNVSRWGLQEKNEGHEAAEEFKDGEMPPWFFRIAHPETWLSDSEEQNLLAGLRSTFGTDKDENED